ncbi:hypothetical protein Vretimale_3090 [Volvox reticuliferus]|uniref:Programmed cell death protein 2 C-terminal domain-containing protein n=1 Tax=Volvox reticuliferus TaxID=1737510 RepID=A0A8J4C995_9CHLO|nr:hypothetical protein Vretifemale_6725 [Volvox reticuliferus]GIL97442.1 hypothetical protein Vretimale_3090 [Volvox reticuliferus]
MPSVETARLAQVAPEDEDEPEEISWNLGFVEKPEKPHLLLRHRFPSKVGGRPAWLDPLRLPSREMLTCRLSGRPLDFLLQIYAPVDANPVEGFHRCLFLFISPEGSRLREPGAVRLFRCQLPRYNPYYSSEPPSNKDKYPQPLKPCDTDASRERDPWRSVDAERPLAAVSISGSPSSAKKRKDAAASAPAEAATTTAAELAGAAPGDGNESGTASVTPAVAAAAPLPRTGVRGPGGLYSELELIVEPEDHYMEEEEEEERRTQPQRSGPAEGGSGEQRGGESGPGDGGAVEGGDGGVEAEVQRALQQYRARVAEEGELDDEELPPDVMEAVEDAAAPEQRCFADFQARVSWAPDQVIRYCFQDGAQPLWPAPHGRPGPGDIPPCPCCGAPRKMEFQVMPQLLHYLQLDEDDPASPDWSTLVAYTCAASCSPPTGTECAYLEEVVWVQSPAP